MSAFGPETYSYTQLADYIIDQLWGYQQVNLLKNNIRNAIDDKLATVYSLNFPRPSFNWNSADTSQIIIPASAAKPAIVRIGNLFYKNTSDLVLDLDTSGIGGLSVGVKAPDKIYYVYGVRPISGSTWLGVIDPNPPTVGPDSGIGVGTNWTYLGSFRTVAASAVNPFTYANGKLSQARFSGATISISTTATTTSTGLIVSAVALSATWLVVFTAVSAIPCTISMGPTSTTTQQIARAGSTTVLANQFQMVHLPMSVPQQVCHSITGATDAASAYLIEWFENPTDYQ